MNPEARREAIRAIGSRLEQRDLDVYAKHGKDPAEPVLGGGAPDARICVFGRDPGKDEIKLGANFVGAAGKKLREGLHRRLRGDAAYDFDAGMRAGERVFWANTVPYKPIGNKPWPMAVVRALRPMVLDLLATEWRGDQILALGDVAFAWFGLDDPALAAAIEAHKLREDRFASSLPVRIGGRVVQVHPLPHPSPLNATWLPKFPGLLDGRLGAIGFSESGWRMP